MKYILLLFIIFFLVKKNYRHPEMDIKKNYKHSQIDIKSNNTNDINYNRTFYKVPNKNVLEYSNFLYSHSIPFCKDNAVNCTSYRDIKYLKNHI
jgi:hypothetical protein